MLAVTPADELGARAADPFCGSAVLGAINELADFSHSKAIADLISDNSKAKDRLILTLGRIGPPRYANFIGRWRDDAEPEVRRSVADALGLVDNPTVTIPVLVQMLARGTGAEAFGVKWEAARSLLSVAKRPGGDAVRPRLVALLGEPDALTVTLAAWDLGQLGDARGLTKLRDLTGHPVGLPAHLGERWRSVVQRRVPDRSNSLGIPSPEAALGARDLLARFRSTDQPETTPNSS